MRKIQVSVAWHSEGKAGARANRELRKQPGRIDSAEDPAWELRTNAEAPMQLHSIKPQHLEHVRDSTPRVWPKSLRFRVLFFLRLDSLKVATLPSAGTFSKGWRHASTT